MCLVEFRLATSFASVRLFFWLFGGRVNDQRNRSIEFKINLHVAAELASLHLVSCIFLLESFDELLEEGLRLIGAHTKMKIGLRPLEGVTQCKLANNEELMSRLFYALLPSLVVLAE